VRTRSRSPAYSGPNTRNDFVFHTRIDEEVDAQVVRSEVPALLRGGPGQQDIRFRLSMRTANV
jgi:hypothetical protein